MKLIKRYAAAFALAACAAGVSIPASAATIVGGSTSVSLTSAPTLIGLGLTITNTGFSTLIGNNPPVVTFLITGGSVDDDDGDAMIAHDGSGLRFSSGANFLSIADFLIDTDAGTITGNVNANGTLLPDVEIFTFDPALTLFLTGTAASAFTSIFGAPDLTGATIGTAVTNPITQATAVPEPVTWLMMIGGFALVGGAMRRRRPTRVLA